MADGEFSATWASRRVVAARRCANRNHQPTECVLVDMKNVVIGILAVAVVVLGYLYWDSQRTKVDIRLPGVTIKGR